MLLGTKGTDYGGYHVMKSYPKTSSVLCKHVLYNLCHGEVACLGVSDSPMDLVVFIQGCKFKSSCIDSCLL